MAFKRFLVLHLQLYCVLVTLIFAASYIVGLIFAPEQNISYSQLVGPFVLAGLCVLPTFITYFRKEPNLKQFIIRSVIQLAVIEVIVLFFIQPPENTSAALFYLLIGAIVLVIYVLAKLTVWLNKYLQSKKLTEQLRAFQANESP